MAKQARKAPVRRKPAAKKAPAKKPVARSVKPKDIKPSNKKDETLHVRKIKNGYLVRRNWVEGEGERAKYKEEEVFSTKPPVIDF